MSDNLYEAQDIWDVSAAAAVERITIETACELLEKAPSPNTVRSITSEMLRDETALEQLGGQVNERLEARLRRSC